MLSQTFDSHNTLELCSQQMSWLEEERWELWWNHILLKLRLSLQVAYS